MIKVAVIGGINIDIEGRPLNKLVPQDSNPAKIRTSFGGVGRNIIENAARLGAKCAMLSVIGEDGGGAQAKAHLESLDVDCSMVRRIPGCASSTYISFLNHEGDMEIAMNDMAIVDLITQGTIRENLPKLESYDALCLDGNLLKETLKYAVENLKGPKLFYDPVSAIKGVRAKDFIGKFYALKPNRMEAEALLDMKIESEEDVKEAGKRFLELGVKEVYITLNRDGIYYADAGSSGFVRPLENLNIVSATGAGDAVSACILTGIAEGRASKEIAARGMAAAAIAMESTSAVNPEMSPELLNRKLQEA